MTMMTMRKKKTMTEANVLRAGVFLDTDRSTTKVLDKGYVRLVDVMGTDLSVVNAARASFAKESLILSQSDARLVHFLAKEGHLSPFRHAFMTFEIKAPLMVARQHWKYVVASDHTFDSWNEASRRYVTSDEEFYLPKANEWRSAPENKKQGSGDPVAIELGSLAMQMLIEDQDRQLAHYRWALDNGICPEQARLFLPAYGLYINYRWSASLQSVLNFLNQRLEEDAQLEIQLYARAVRDFAKRLFPVSMNAFGL
jgi:thymidylate synthase (FAD)